MWWRRLLQGCCREDPKKSPRKCYQNHSAALEREGAAQTWSFHLPAHREKLGAQSKAFVTFIDLRKAYDSVPRAPLWAALGKLGIPEPIITLIKSFHQGMTELDGRLLDPFPVANGLRQECVVCHPRYSTYTWQ